MADSNNELNRNLRHQCLKLPTGKKYYFYIVAAEDDREQVEEIVIILKERFHLKCLYDVVDCYPGVDKFNFMKAGMKDYKIILEDVGEETFSLLSFLKFVNARCVDAAGVASKIAESVESLDLSKSMFPLEFANVIARFENGYSVEIPVEKDILRFNRPAKRKFHVNRDLLTELTNSQMKDYLEYFIQERRQLLPADLNISPKEYALNLIEIHTAEISKVMTLNYDDLPDASQNRHTLRKGKECLCQRIERCLSLVERTNII
ncbi:uncharacterized protein LOC132736544 [Ruditapes philippinarum]|uniref:uncharacterized protein LOC132736544 n=1 Tax=Ruditapes philippinarum TaxID=129788 RepID=UPI00295BC286|nr:uncharacterized protein LOC132736544 [Ruditapes philippinarum]